KQMFFFTDQALRARIQTLQQFYYIDAKSLPKYNADISKIIDSLESMQTPDHLVPVRDLIVSAIQDQQNFFKRWAAQAGTSGYDGFKAALPNDPDTQSAHRKLVEAYDDLKKIYPNESEYNQQAFFDHLCGLD